jgi:hypothetical protein
MSIILMRLAYLAAQVVLTGLGVLEALVIFVIILVVIAVVTF